MESGVEPKDAALIVRGSGRRTLRIDVAPGREGERRDASVWVDGVARGRISLKPVPAGDGEVRFGDGSRGAGGEALWDEVRLLGPAR